MVWGLHSVNTLYKHPTTQTDLLLQDSFPALRGLCLRVQEAETPTAPSEAEMSLGSAATTTAEPATFPKNLPKSINPGAELLRSVNPSKPQA